MTSDLIQRAGKCPVIHYDYAPVRPVGSYRAKAQELRDSGVPVWVNTVSQGFWMVTDPSLVREVYMTPDIFTTDSLTAVDPELKPEHLLLPLNVNPPEHKKYRMLLNPWFAPPAINANEEMIRGLVRKVVEGFASEGQVEAARSYAAMVPVVVLLAVAGMPLDLAERCIDLVDDFMRGFSGAEQVVCPGAGRPSMDASATAIHDMMGEVIEERRRNPKDPKTDFFTYLVTEKVEGRLLTDEELRGIGLIYVVGGMETTRAQLGWLLYHMAKVPEDRRRVLEDPSLLPLAIEEVIRYYTVIWGVGRKVGKDVSWHGVDLRKGDMVYAHNETFNRNPKRFENPDSFQLDRKAVGHMSFGLGAHSCIGMHLARAQLRIAFEEFHRLIPEYQIQDGAELFERGSEVTIQSLPLVWKMTAA